MLRGNAVVAQSGGPTTVINASACGVIQEALRKDAIENVYGANNGILGILNEDLFDLGQEDAETIEGLRCTPSSAIGSCRHKLKSLEESSAEYQRILDVFQAHQIRYFFYIGGNDSMDTADKLNQLAQSQNLELRVMGVPKTIDNDLPITDHCPGFGSVAKYLAAPVMECARHPEALHTHDTVTILEAMGRDTGWIAASTGLARRVEQDAPHLIYVPEIPFSEEQFIQDVRSAHERFGGVFVVVSEGIRDAEGNYVSAGKGKFAQDSFGHIQLGGVAGYLQSLVEKEVDVKCRFNKPGTAQRNAMHFASLTDNEEAYRCGVEAVKQAIAGTSGMMVTLVRESDSPYQCSTGLARLADIANEVKKLPREFMNEQGNGITDAFRRYVTPLIQGEVPLRMDGDGLPIFSRFQRQAVPKQTTES